LTDPCKRDKPADWPVNKGPIFKRAIRIVAAAAWVSICIPCLGWGADGCGFPLPGVVFIFLFPADKVPGHPEYRDAREIAQSAAQLEAPL
jgi:hypothetical protein